MCERCGCGITSDKEIDVVETETLPTDGLTRSARVSLMRRLEQLSGVRDVSYEHKAEVLRVKCTRDAADNLKAEVPSRVPA